MNRMRKNSVYPKLRAAMATGWSQQVKSKGLSWPAAMSHPASNLPTRLTAQITPARLSPAEHPLVGRTHPGSWGEP